MRDNPLIFPRECSNYPVDMQLAIKSKYKDGIDFELYKKGSDVKELSFSYLSKDLTLIRESTFKDSRNPNDRSLAQLECFYCLTRKGKPVLEKNEIKDAIAKCLDVKMTNLVFETSGLFGKSRTVFLTNPDQLNNSLQI